VPRRTPKNLPQLQDKRAEVVRLRAQGLTWDEVAARTGYAAGSGAYRAWAQAIKQAPDESVDEIRRAEKLRLAEIDSVLSGVIANVPVKTTSIGRTQWDVRTCECPVKARTDRDHDPDCPVQPVLDVAQLLHAADLRVRVGAELRKLTGADAPAHGPSVVIDQRRTTILLAEINHDRALRGQPPMPPIPGTILE